MRTVVDTLLLVLVVAGARPVRGEAPAKHAPAEQTITVGTEPAIEGRWLVLSSFAGKGPARNVAVLWEVKRVQGQLTVVDRLVALPDEQAKKVAQGGWDPTPEDLAAIAKAWDGLQTTGRGVTNVKNEVIGRDAFNEALKQDTTTKDALWVVRQAYDFPQGGDYPMKELYVFAAKAPDGDGFGGSYTSAKLDPKPHAFPLAATGTFRMFRVKGDATAGH